MQSMFLSIEFLLAINMLLIVGLEQIEFIRLRLLLYDFLNEEYKYSTMIN